jgi:hypothetical protein
MTRSPPGHADAYPAPCMRCCLSFCLAEACRTTPAAPSAPVTHRRMSAAPGRCFPRRTRAHPASEGRLEKPRLPHPRPLSGLSHRLSGHQRTEPARIAPGHAPQRNGPGHRRYRKVESKRRGAQAGPLAFSFVYEFIGRPSAARLFPVGLWNRLNLVGGIAAWTIHDSACHALPVSGLKDSARCALERPEIRPAAGQDGQAFGNRRFFRTHSDPRINPCEP